MALVEKHKSIVGCMRYVDDSIFFLMQAIYEVSLVSTKLAFRESNYLFI